VTAVTVDRSTGRLVADASTIERLKALAASDAAMLSNAPRSPAARSPRRPWRPDAGRVQPVATGEDIEQTLIGLMEEVSVEAKRSFQLARDHTQPGQLVELRDIHIHQAARLTRAYAELVEALARRKGIVIEHRHHLSISAFREAGSAFNARRTRTT
jgi:hypothetical protein